MISKKTLWIRFFIIFAVFGLSFGLSTAYFATNITGNDTASSVNLKILNLAISLIDEPGFTELNVAPNSTVEKTVIVTNPSSENFTFSLVWDKITNGFSDRTLLTYEVECVSYANYTDIDNSLPPESPSTCTGMNEAYSPPSSTTDVGILSEVTIPAGKAYKYILTLKVSPSLPAGVIVSFTGAFGLITDPISINHEYVPVP